MTRRGLMVVTIGTMALMIVGTALAQGPVLLRHQWQAGEEITWDVSVEMEGVVVVEDLKVDPPGRQRLDMTVTTATTKFQTIEEVDEDGVATVLTEIGPIAITTDMGTGTMQHVTIDPQTGTMVVDGAEIPLPENARAAVGRTVRQVLSPRGELLETDASWDASTHMTGGIIMPQELMNVLERAPMVFPEGEVGEGYCWAQTADLELSGDALADERDATLPPISYVSSYKMAGFEDVGGVECARIEFIGAADIEGVLETPMPGDENDAVTRFGPAHFGISGTIWFDHAGGRMLRVEARVVMDLIQEVEGRVKHGEQIGDMHTRISFEGLDVSSTAERIDEG